MAKLPKKYAADFYKAQEEVRKALQPYQARCTGQYFEASSAIETFVVYSKEQDAFEGRHRLRGIVTVWYGYGISRGDRCAVNISLDAGMVGCGSGDFEEILAKAIPAMPPEAIAA